MTRRSLSNLSQKDLASGRADPAQVPLTKSGTDPLHCWVPAALWWCQVGRKTASFSTVLHRSLMGSGVLPGKQILCPMNELG